MNKEIDDYLPDLGADSAWNRLPEDKQDQESDRYCLDLLLWFAGSYKPLLYFAGAYEESESKVIETVGLSQVYSGKWHPEFSKVLTEVNVHELALVSPEHQIVVYESWDNIMATIPPENLPARFSRGLE